MIGRRSTARPKVHAAIRHHIQRGYVFGHAIGMITRQHDHAQTESQACGLL